MQVLNHHLINTGPSIDGVVEWILSLLIPVDPPPASHVLQDSPARNSPSLSHALQAPPTPNYSPPSPSPVPRVLPACYSPLAPIPFPPPVNPEDAVPKIEATVSKLDPGAVGGEGILKFFSRITQEAKAVEIKQQFEVLHESSASWAEAAKLRAATVVASRREYNRLRQANLRASRKRTLTDVPKNGDKKCQIDTPDIMTSSQSLFQSAGPLNVAQVSRPKRGLMIKERETSKMKGPHQSGRRQTKEIKEAVWTYWWAPTFFLLLTEAAEKVCWVGPTKIVQQAQCTSPSLFKKLTSQVIGRHIVKGKGWNDDALRKESLLGGKQLSEEFWVMAAPGPGSDKMTVDR
ncbi:uncharacterized protein EI90DRAFT_3020047 [Cantharellus anzutake]|uniref:uncharacterized protein n=1 Tax=Cantharellus anzutake TaxID=1750568 RepID=UPI0019047711|nr:uncharacterized protein EI90DRAFT_3020047 [Cantharellus anzutake]KAF8322784.1 hypothetical protein EI90DRAFT_3020047 [Cantharellus anzutake]